MKQLSVIASPSCAAIYVSIHWAYSIEKRPLSSQWNCVHKFQFKMSSTGSIVLNRFSLRVYRKKIQSRLPNLGYLTVDLSLWISFIFVICYSVILKKMAEWNRLRGKSCVIYYFTAHYADNSIIIFIRCSTLAHFNAVPNRECTIFFGDHFQGDTWAGIWIGHRYWSGCGLVCQSAVFC